MSIERTQPTVRYKSTSPALVTGSAKLKVVWAEKHMRDLNELLEPLRDSTSYEVIPKYYPQTSQLVLMAGNRVPEIVNEIRLLTGDVLHNLRCALDHIIFSIAATELGSDHVRQNIIRWQFPISRSTHPPTLNNEIRAFSEVAKDLILGTDARRGGNESLWLLHELNIRDKHHMFVTVCHKARVNVNSFIIPHLGAEFSPETIEGMSKEKLFKEPVPLRRSARTPQSL